MQPITPFITSSPDITTSSMTSSTFYNDIEVRGVVKSLAGKSIGTVTEMSAATGKNKGCAVLYLGAEAGYTAGMVYVSDGE